ncbi:MAG: MltA domain-containing protein [Rhodobacteraceae bacterium]|nr:MltA domain-containing protein [Paracoccaceae bacterium]
MSAAARDHVAERFDNLLGWAEDDHEAALAVFLNSCRHARGEAFAPLCHLAATGVPARPFFETFFRPVVMRPDDGALFTGYFEPELSGARARSGRYRHPIYRRPPDLPQGQPWATRAEIEGGLLEGRALEIAWIDDPVEVFFLQIQGSGRVRLSDGARIRVGYGGHNGHPYRSVGQELVRRGLFEAHQVSAQVIRNWVRRNPDEGRALLHTNPSFVFFREIDSLAPEDGPIGAMGLPITTLRSIAVDPAWVPLGAPVWVEKGGARPMRRLMIAQDTGSAIKGAQRGDIFYGTGDDAGREAGHIRDPGRMVVLLPIETARQLLGEED